MQGSKQIERAARTRTKNPGRVAKALEREKKDRAVSARASKAHMNRPMRRALASVGAL